MQNTLKNSPEFKEKYQAKIKEGASTTDAMSSTFSEIMSGLNNTPLGSLGPVLAFAGVSLGLIGLISSLFGGGAAGLGLAGLGLGGAAMLAGWGGGFNNLASKAKGYVSPPPMQAPLPYTAPASQRIGRSWDKLNDKLDSNIQSVQAAQAGNAYPIIGPRSVKAELAKKYPNASPEQLEKIYQLVTTTGTEENPGVLESLQFGRGVSGLLRRALPGAPAK